MADYDFKTKFTQELKPDSYTCFHCTDKEAEKVRSYFQRRKIPFPQDYIDFIGSYNYFYYRQDDNTNYCPVFVRIYGYSRRITSIITFYKNQRKYEKELEKINGNNMPPDRYLLIGSLSLTVEKRLFEYDLAYNLHKECYEIIKNGNMFPLRDTDILEKEAAKRRFQEKVLNVPPHLLEDRVASFSGIYELLYAVCCGELFKVQRDDDSSRKININNKLLKMIRSQITPSCVTPKEAKKFMRYAQRKLYIPMLPEEYLRFLTEVSNGFMQCDAEAGGKLSVFSMPTRRLKKENRFYYDLNSLAEQCDYDDDNCVITIGATVKEGCINEIKCDIFDERYFMKCRDGELTYEISFRDFYEALYFAFELFHGIRKD